MTMQASHLPLLVAEKLEVVYHHAITAIQGVSLTVQEGQIVAILGTNGAGKSTTLRALSGFLGIDNARVTEGTITFRGKRIENRPPNELTRLGIALIPEREKVFPNLTVADNLSAPFAPAMSKAERKQREEQVYHFFPRLGDLRARIVGRSPACAGMMASNVRQPYRRSASQVRSRP